MMDWKGDLRENFAELLRSFRLVELKKVCSKFSLTQSGRKEVVVMRIVNHCTAVLTDTSSPSPLVAALEFLALLSQQTDVPPRALDTSDAFRGSPFVHEMVRAVPISSSSSRSSGDGPSRLIRLRPPSQPPNKADSRFSLPPFPTPAVSPERMSEIRRVLASKEILPEGVVLADDALVRVSMVQSHVSKLRSRNMQVEYQGEPVFLKAIPTFYKKGVTFSLEFPKELSRQGCEHIAMSVAVRARLQSQWKSIGEAMDRIDDIFDSYETFYIFCGRVVRILSLEELVEKTVSTKLRSYETCKEQVLASFSADDDVIDVSSRVSLLCPLGMTLLKTPTKSEGCSHLACFDLLNYLKMYKRATVWKCPICSCIMSPKTIYVDGFFREIVNSAESRNAEIEEVVVERDGTWQLVENDLAREDEEENEDSEMSLKSPVDEKDKETLFPRLGRLVDVNPFPRTETPHNTRRVVVDLADDDDIRENAESGRKRNAEEAGLPMPSPFRAQSSVNSGTRDDPIEL